MPIAGTHGDIDYEESGSGPTVVLLPGSFSTTSAWRPVAKLLTGRFRVVTTSLPGYGGTAEVRDADGRDIGRLAEAMETVIRAAGGPVHLVGHSFGGCVAMAVAVGRRVPLSGLTMFEANPVGVLLLAGEVALHGQAHGMLAAYAAATAATIGDVAADVIDFWGGAGSFAAMPDAVKAYVRANAAVNARDWSSALAFAADAGAYRAVACPGHMVYGAEGHPVARRTAEILADLLPRGRVSAMSGASHFMISTHVPEVAAIIAADAAVG